MSPAPAIEPSTTQRGLLRRGIEALQRHYSGRHLELLRADDLTTVLGEMPDMLALRARAVSRFLGRPVRVGENPLAAAAPVRLCRVDTDEGMRVRLLLTDDGVEQLRRRLGIRCLVTDGPRPDGEFTRVRVQAHFPGGDVVEQIGRSLTKAGDAERKARSAAIRAVVYGFCGIPPSSNVTVLPAGLLTGDMVHRSEPREMVLQSPDPVASEPVDAVADAPVASEVVPAVALMSAPQASPLSPIRDQDDDLDVARSRVYRYLAGSGWTNDEEVSEQLSYWLGVPTGTSVAELDPASLLLASEEIEHWLPPRQANVSPSMNG